MANTHSLLLNGTTQCFTIPSGIFYTDFTISCWIKADETQGDSLSVICSLGEDTVRLILYNGEDEHNRKLILQRWTGSGYDFNLSTSAIPDDEWTFIAVSYNGTTRAYAFYIGTGAVADASGTASNAISYSANTGAWGARRVADAYFFKGYLDDCRIYDAIRSGADIASDCQKEVAGDATNLQAYWKLNNNYNDETANEYDGTGVNTPTFSTDIPDWPVVSSSGFFLFM